MSTPHPSLGDATFLDLEKSLPQSDLKLLQDLVLVDSFTSEEATKISGNLDAGRRCELLLKNEVLIQIDTNPRKFQINSIICDQLRLRLSSNQERFRLVAKTSANVLAQRNPLKALELFGLAGDITSATDLIRTNLRRFIFEADYDLTLKWASVVNMALGGGIWREKLIRAYGQFASGRFDELRAQITELESLSIGADEIKILKRDLLQFKMFNNFAFGHFLRNSNSEVQLTELLLDINEENKYSHLVSIRTLLVTSFYLQDTKNFLTIHGRYEKYLKEFDSKFELITIHSFRAMREFLTGNYIKASEFALASVNLAEEYGIVGTHFPFESVFILMDTYLEFGDEAKSQKYVDKYLPLALKYQQYPWITAFYAKGAVIEAQAGKIASALNILKKGRESIQSPLFGDDLWFYIDGNELLIRLSLGEMNRVNELLFRIGDKPAINSLKISLEIMKNPNEVEKLAKLMPEQSVLDVFRKQLLLATALISEKKVAKKHLDIALGIAKDNGYFRAFLLANPALKSLIIELAEEKPTNYLENLSRAIRAQSSLSQAKRMGIDKPLTKSELRILRRLSAEISISQIAQELQISKNTIKTHLKSMYRKLNVESRRQAVEKGYELALL